jgi:hypothetical protein
VVTTEFANTLTRGFADMGEHGVAVCLLAGTEIAFDAEVTWDRFPGLFGAWWRRRKALGKVARFRKINQRRNQRASRRARISCRPDGAADRLSPGQRATVLQLPGPARPAKEMENSSHPSIPA